jgi:hypothetical protein
MNTFKEIEMKNKKYKEYSFSAKQIIQSYGMVYIRATSIKEAREMLKKVKRDTIDWYDDSLPEQLEHNKVSFKLEGIENIQ